MIENISKAIAGFDQAAQATVDCYPAYWKRMYDRLVDEKFTEQ